MFAGFARWIGFLTMAAGATGALLLAGGFGWFVAQIAGDEITLDRRADGIVVLTGSAARIPDAREIARVTPLYSKYFNCCIDLDRSALNTFGNALETKRWARQHNFNSLIVVTSNWHMPRAMAELDHQLPDVTLIAFPVISEKVKAEPWWANLDTARLLFGEYLKYVFAQARMRLDVDGAI
jgi:hypothetical protein